MADTTVEVQKKVAKQARGRPKVSILAGEAYKQKAVLRKFRALLTENKEVQIKVKAKYSNDKSFESLLQQLI